MKFVLKPLAVLALLGLVASNTTALLLLKTQVDFLSMGFSGGKTFLLLAFLFALFATERLPLPWRTSWNWLLFPGVGLLHLIGLVERYLFWSPLGEPWRAYQAAISDGRYSSTRLAHLHEPKACMAWLLGYRGTGFDSGFQFLPYFPTWLLAGQAALLLLTAAVGFMVVHHYQRQNSTAKTLTLALSVFAFVKVSVDGGPFSTEAIVPLFFLLGCLYGGRGVKLGALLTLVVLPFDLWLFGGSLGFQVGKAVGGYMLLCAPLLWEEARERESLGGLFAVVGYCGLLLVLPWLFFRPGTVVSRPPYAQGTLAYSYTALTPGSTAYIFSPGELQGLEKVGLQPVEVWKELGMQVCRATVVRETKPGEIARAFGLNISWQPVTWFPRPIYHDMTGTFPKEPPAGWPRSKMVLAYKWQPLEDGRVRIQLALQGGGLANAAYACLPEGNFVATRYSYSERQPNMKDWIHGPGWAEGLPAFGPAFGPASGPASGPALGPGGQALP